MDFDILKELPFKAHFLKHHINEVLVLSGDVPQDLSKRVYHTNTIDFIRKIRQEMPHLKIYADYLQGTEVYWGISPVTSEASQSYWQAKNNAIFPREFNPTFDWNIDFARMTLDYVRKHDLNIYFMPIRTNLREYLEPIFK